MINQKITKWGNSLGIRLPQSLIQKVGWQEGEQITITTNENQIILSVAKPKYCLEELLKNANPEDQQSEIDWGESRGAEIYIETITLA